MEINLDNFLRTSPSTVASQKDHGRNKGWPWSPKPTHPKTGLHVFTFSDLKNTYLDLLIMIKTHDKERKIKVQRLNPKRKMTKGNLN